MTNFATVYKKKLNIFQVEKIRVKMHVCVFAASASEWYWSIIKKKRLECGSCIECVAILYKYQIVNDSIVIYYYVFFLNYA